MYPESPEAVSKAVLWNNGSVTEIIPGNSISIANDINNSNTVAGMVDYEPFIWNSTTGLQRLGGYSDIGSVGRLFFAKAINDSNHLVGGHTANEEGFAQRAFYWDGVSARDIGTLGITSIPPGGNRPVVGANDINNADQVVGDAAVGFDTNGLLVTHAFIWDEENGMRDLNNLIPADSGIVLTQATGINNFGDIVAVGYVVGNNPYIQRGYRLTMPREKLPLIFIPGIAGSTLYEADANGDPITGELYSEIWTDGIFNPTGSTLSKLYLTPNLPHPNIIAVDAVRRVAPYANIYKPLLDELKKDYIEYDIQGNPKKRNTQCTGGERYNGEKPTLFVFAYDWRQSNVDAATQLKQFVDCVQLFHPGIKVDILTHSLGGLIARRYVVDHPNDHNIDKLITTVAPFLGAPKAIDGLFTGRFIGKTFLYGIPIGGGAGIYFYQDIIKEIVSYSKGAHELLPSAWYYGLGERPFGYRNSILPFVTDYPFIEANEVLNARFPSRPYNTANEFHNYQLASQDNWSLDTSGVKFYHIYGVQSWDITPSKVVVTPFITYPKNVEQLKYGVEVSYSEGDGTVPTISAGRVASLIAPNTRVKQCNSPSWFSDGSYDHNGITKNPVLWNEIKAILNETPINQPECVNTYSSPSPEYMAQKNALTQETSQNNSIEINSLKIYGVDRLQITDEFGNTNSALGIGVEKSVPEIDYESGSNSTDSLAFPHEVNFATGKIVDIKFIATSEKIRIELFKGTSRQDSSEAIKYMDLQLPLGVIAWLKFNQTVIVDPPTSTSRNFLSPETDIPWVENLRYDADGDGIFETEVQPTFSLTGASANDRTPPNIDISFSVNNNVATVTVIAADNETGINQIRYIANDETSDHIYTAPFTVNLTQSKLLYVSAEDNAGNRNLLAKWIDVSAPITTATQNPTPNNSGWSKTDIGVVIKALDDLGGSGVEMLTFSGSGAQTIPEETLAAQEIPFTFPQPSTSADFLSKSLTIDAEGITNLTFFAKDKAGNTEATKTVAVKIDKTAPTSTGNFVLTGQQATVTLSSTDVLSGAASIFYSVDGGSQQTYSSSFIVSGVGNHIVSYFSVDLAGNIESAKTLNISIANANLAVRPVLECVVANGNGTYTAKFGYKNDNSVSIVIPVGANNKFSPNPQNRNQTTNFQPGRIRFAFEVLFNGSNLVWTLKGPDNQGRTSTASANSARCQ